MQSRAWRRLAALVVCLVGAGPAALAAERIEDFAARALDGAEFRLSNLESKYVVVVFLGTECPLVKQYLPQLEKLAASGGDTTVLGVMSNWLDTPEKINEFRSTHRVSFPLLPDPDAVLADRFGATRTPEAFLLDEHRQIRYHGAIDDRFGVDYRRSVPRRDYLATALDAVLAGRAVTQVHQPAVGCRIGRRPRPKPDAEITWYADIFPLFQRRCHECHRAGGAAPFSLVGYEEAAGWAAMIDEVVKQSRMPPWYAADSGYAFANDCRLTLEERRQIAAWIEQGTPPGDARQAPPARQFPDEWVHEPDLVLAVTDQPVRVPADGPAFIVRFLIDPKWSEGRWIKGVECRPGNREVVHHLGVFVVAPSADPLQHWARRFLDFLFGYSPGILDLTLPDGMAQYVPPGAQLLVELHYVPNGAETSDASRIALRFADAAQVKHLVRTRLVVNDDPIEIPPYVPDYVVRGESRIEVPSQLLAVTGHAHVRCRSFRFQLAQPEGAKTLVNIPDYDMFWQQLYEFKRPLPLPRGTVVQCVAHYDNSSGYRRNPDPSATIYDGDEDVFGNEMMNGFLIVAEPRPAVLPTIADAQDLFPLRIQILSQLIQHRRAVAVSALGVVAFSVLALIRRAVARRRRHHVSCSAG